MAIFYGDGAHQSSSSDEYDGLSATTNLTAAGETIIIFAMMGVGGGFGRGGCPALTCIHVTINYIHKMNEHVHFL